MRGRKNGVNRFTKRILLEELRVTTFLMDEKNHHIFPVPSNSEAIEIFLVGSLIALVCALVIAIKSGDV
jgi:hypothetical protein